MTTAEHSRPRTFLPRSLTPPVSALFEPVVPSAPPTPSSAEAAHNPALSAHFTGIVLEPSTGLWSIGFRGQHTQGFQTALAALAGLEALMMRTSKSQSGTDLSVAIPTSVSALRPNLATPNAMPSLASAQPPPLLTRTRAPTPLARIVSLDAGVALGTGAVRAEVTEASLAVVQTEAAGGEGWAAVASATAAAAEGAPIVAAGVVALPLSAPMAATAAARRSTRVAASAERANNASSYGSLASLPRRRSRLCSTARAAHAGDAMAAAKMPSAAVAALVEATATEGGEEGEA